VSARNRFGIILGVVLVLSAAYYFLTTSLSGDLVLIGTVDANQVVVSAKIPGRIERLAVDEGTAVKAGDLVAELDTAELSAQAQAAQARVAETRATERLTKGTTTSDVVNAQARAQAARSDLSEAQAQLERVRTDNVRIVALAREGVASQQQKDQSEAEMKAAQARVAAAQDAVRAADAEVTAAIARTHQQGAAQSNVAATRAQAQEAAARLGYTRVVSPVTGTVSVRVARQGEVLMAGAPIVTIVDYSQTWVRAAIPETYADRIQLGDTLPVRLPSGACIDGKVILKQAEADFATQRDVSRSKRDIKAIGLKLLIENPGGKYTPGMTAEVLIPKSRLESK
jgi:multidrug resistance efflux pump